MSQHGQLLGCGHGGTFLSRIQLITVDTNVYSSQGFYLALFVKPLRMQTTLLTFFFTSCRLFWTLCILRSFSCIHKNWSTVFLFVFLPNSIENGSLVNVNPRCYIGRLNSVLHCSEASSTTTILAYIGTYTHMQVLACTHTSTNMHTCKYQHIRRY